MSGAYDVRRTRQGFAVWHAGVRVSGFHHGQETALTVAQKLADRAGRRVRRCLRCGGDFPSTHVGNRLCGPCKASPEMSGPEW